MTLRHAGSFLVFALLCAAGRAEVFTLQEAPITDMQRAMESRALTSVQVRIPKTRKVIGRANH